MGECLFLVFLRVPGRGKLLVEFVNPASSVNEFHLTREKRMGLAGNFQFNERILITVLPYDRIAGRSARTRQKGLITGEILKNHRSVFFWMRVFLHVEFLFGKGAKVAKIAILPKLEHRIWSTIWTFHSPVHHFLCKTMPVFVTITLLMRFPAVFKKPVP